LRGTPSGTAPTGEGVLHKECKMYLSLNKQIHTQYGTITADRVLMEREAANHIKQHVPGFSLIPDCLFLDHTGKIICVVEVCISNAKEEEQIEQYRSYQIPVIELKYENDYHHPAGINFLYVSPSYHKTKFEENSTLKEIRREELSNDTIGFEIERVQRKIDKLDSERRGFENTIPFQQRQINEYNEKIRILEDQVTDIEGKIYQNITAIREARAKHKEAIKQVRGGKQRIVKRTEETREASKRIRNSFIQAAKRCKIEWYRPGFYQSNRNDIEEFFYWCT
jgi:hypothetical protein